MPRICKDDIVIVDEKLRKQLGAGSNILVVTKIGQMIKFMDPNTLNLHEVTGKKYFELEGNITIVPFHDYKSEFMILDVEEDTYARSHNTSL